jgi:hypothetical protein
VAAFLAYRSLGIKVCTERMIRYLCKDVFNEEETQALMSTLHKLGDFKVITVIRTPKIVTGEAYRFLLTSQFLKHIGEFWKSKQ